MENTDTGFLLNKHNILLQRIYFKQMLDFRGITVLHRAPKPGTKNYDLHGELNSQYELPVEMKCIFEEHPTQWTMKKYGWDSVLNDGNSLIQVPYGVEEAQQELAGMNEELRTKPDNAHTVQAGSLFIIPSGLDKTKGRVFRVLRMSNIAVYPANITCEIGPVFADSFEKSNLEPRGEETPSGLTLLNIPSDEVGEYDDD